MTRSSRDENSGASRPAAHQRSWFSNSHLREWLNVAAALGTILIGVIGLWNTTQISGLQDYFQSEIARRNQELNAQSKAAERLEAEASVRERQLTALGTESDKLVADALEQSAMVEQATNQLGDLRYELINKRSELAEITLAAKDLQTRTASQARDLETLLRRRTFENLAFLALTVYFDQLPGYDESPARIYNFGEKLYESLQKATPGPTEAALSPNYERAKLNITRVCPQLRSYEVTAAAIPPKVQAVGEPVKKDMDAKEYARNLNANLAEYSRKAAERIDASQVDKR